MGQTPLPAKRLAVLAVLALMAGCQQGTGPLTPVHGKVTYRGIALQGGTIVFAPDASRGGSGPLALAEIQPDGSYTLRSGEAYGAVSGWHRVTVAAVYTPGATAGQHFAVPLSVVPDRYRDPQLSGLICEVKADLPNVFNFNLE
jgi:hypothetical protein